jgi:hypothetical protein
MQSQLSNQNQGLGDVKSIFGPNQANAKMILYVIPIFLLVGIVLIGSIPIGGIVMFVVAGGLFWGYRAQLRARAEVRAGGVFLTDWLGRQHSFRWEDVTAVYEFVGYHQRTWAPNQWVYTVHTRDGQQIKLDMAYEKTHQLGYMVLSETGKNFLPQYLELYRTGKNVPIADGIAVNSQGFLAGAETLPWNQVSKVEFGKRGDLMIHQADHRVPWKLLMHPRIANYPTFRAFLHEVGAGSLIQSLIEDPLYEQAKARTHTG